jgi:hypothetical protein
MLNEVRARRFTRDLGEGEEAMRVIECADCGRRVESINDALCPSCLEDFMSSGIDLVMLIP